GVVSRESSSANGGIQLYLQGDNGVEYFYAHLSGYAVSTGSRVRAGQLIAYNGQTGNARYTAPHVHFEVHPGGGSPVNPYPHLKPVCGCGWTSSRCERRGCRGRSCDGVPGGSSFIPDRRPRRRSYTGSTGSDRPS